MQDIICELQDMKHLDWAARKMSPGTPGCFLKAYEEVNGKRLYYKYRNKIWEMIWKRWCFFNRYAIRRNNRNKIVGILNYDEKEKKYTIEIPENVTPKEAPFMISLFLKKGIRTMNSDWSMRWVQSRIIPSSRQNIGEILRVNGMRSYDEHKLLLKNEGRSCQDEFYIEHM